MTKAQHTPGPWEITGHGSRPTPCTWVSLGDEDDGNSLEVVGGNHVTNARLIAEAPAMLDALRKAIAVINDFMPNIANCSLDDYAALNEVLVEAPAILARIGGRNEPPR